MNSGARDSRAPMPATRTVRVPGRNGLNVLVVEDDEADAYLISNALERHPRIAGITFARDGVEAMAHLDRTAVSPDFAIVDLHMPRKNGLALLVELRCRNVASFPVIILTSSSAINDGVRSRLRGADGFLIKPDSFEELECLLSETIAAVQACQNPPVSRGGLDWWDGGR